MTTRKLYSEELVQLSESLEEMGNLVEASLKNLFFSIENKDMQLAERIVADDRNVNNLERSILRKSGRLQRCGIRYAFYRIHHK